MNTIFSFNIHFVLPPNWLNSNFFSVECVKPKDSQELKDFKKKFSMENISLQPRKVKFVKLQAGNETEETRHMNIAQLERAVLLDQLKYYRMQLKEIESKKVEVKKQATRNLLEERDCIAVWIFVLLLINCFFKHCTYMYLALHIYGIEQYFIMIDIKNIIIPEDITV